MPKKLHVKKKHGRRVTAELKFPETHEILNIDGVDNVTLNSTSQKIIGCVVGQDVTVEKPWLFINKEVIVENLELHENSSEFLPLSEQIEAYPEKEILMGYDKPVGRDLENFLICTTVDAKNTMMHLLEVEEQNKKNMVYTMMCKYPTVWNSLGSEREVDDLIIKQFRPQLYTEIQFPLPRIKSKELLTLRLAEQVKYGYLEMLPGEFKSDCIIFKKQCDAGVQAGPEIVSKFCETIHIEKTNKVTQYNYAYEDVKLTFKIIDGIANFFKCHKAYLFYQLDTNQYFDLYRNEYEQLKHKEINKIKFNLNNITSFKDEIYCQGINVSAMTWHPLISGIIAAAYIINPGHQVISKEPGFNCERDELEAHLVLIWCESSPHKPKIYLRSPRAVNCLFFCPTNYHLLVGGLTNGQIVIWDLTNKLTEAEHTEVLTSEETEHRFIIRSFMSWIKDIYDPRHINRPTVVSSLIDSHTEPVTGISWLQPEYEFDKLGHVIINPQAKNLQFFSSGMDSIIYVWDLNQRAIIIEDVVKKKKRSRPKEILVDPSPFRPLNTQLRPFYKIIIQNPLNMNILPITVIAFRTTNSVYKIDKIDKIKNRIYFEYVLSENVMEYNPQILLATAFGGIITARWSGLPFNQGVQMHSEKAEINEFNTVHDGPITVCVFHPVHTNYFLTVGGKVFAAWNIDNIALPLYWRKSSRRYVSGIWSPNHPFAVLIASQNFTYQLWNLLHLTKKYKHEIKSMDSALMDLYWEHGKDHVIKGRMATTNLIGLIKIYKFPNLPEMPLDLLKHSRSEVENILIERENIVTKIFKKGDKIKFALSLEEVHSGQLKVSEDIPNIEPEKKVVLAVTETPCARKFRETLEQYVYESILIRHGINKTDIQNQVKPLKKKLRTKLNKERKLKALIQKREELFEKAKKFVAKRNFECLHQIKGINLLKEQLPQIKNQYLNSYNAIEAKSLCIMKREPFNYTFDWSEVLNKKKRKFQIMKANMELS